MPSPVTACAVLFDLDGTLTDPREGITRCYQYALQKLQLPVPPAEELLWSIGPGIQKVFEQLLGPERLHLREQGIAFYRERFAPKGLYENAVFPGVPELLATLHAQKRPLFLATAKPTVYATEILRHFDLQKYFTGIYGSELDGTHSNKVELLKHLLAREPDAAGGVMVGDRHFDILAAKANDLRSIGVLFGYGSREELLEAGAPHLAHTVNELRSLLLGE